MEPLILLCIFVVFIIVVIVYFHNKSNRANYNHGWFSIIKDTYNKIKPDCQKEESYQKNQSQYAIVNECLQRKIAELEAELNFLKNEINSLSCNFANLSASVRSDQGVLKDFADKLADIQFEMANAKSQQQCLSRNDAIPLGRKYAGFVDSNNPLGFSDIELSDISDSKIYVINILSDGSAEYGLVDDAGIHIELVQTLNSGILSAGCDFINAPDSFSNKIETSSLGRLVFDGKVWCIKEKCKIKFL